ncbi:hypothetical protein [Mammaliicoccus sciuri]|uniref:hypothetical protein n=1 Tax=Mammaliicoccus sciuri TaxID=1296 RepID=UPI003F57DD03
MKIKFTHATLLILTLALLLNMLIPQGLAQADDEKSVDTIDVDKLVKKEKDEGGNDAVLGKGAKELEDESMWTIYAQILMKEADSKEEKRKAKEDDKGRLEKAFNGMVSGVIGDGGISVDVPFNKMYSMSNQLRGNENEKDKDKSGTQLASVMSTYSNYGYWETVSGSRLAQSIAGSMNAGFKFVFGTIVIISLALYYMIDGLLMTVVNAMIELNPFKLLGFGDDTTAFKNPINKAIQNMFNYIGLDNAFFEALSSFGLIFIIAVFGFMLMKYLADKNLQGIWAVLRKFAVQIFTIFAMIPLIMMLYSEVGKSVKNIQENNSITSDLASQYIVNVRGWAASQNLSPSGIENDEVPFAYAENGHVDKDFDPTNKRSMISDINRNTYTTLYGQELNKKMGFQLVDNWMKDNTFNVNTYIGDIQRGYLPDSENDTLPAYEGYNKYYPKAAKKDIEYVIWSGTQNVDEKLRNVKNEQFKPDKPIGVRGNTFSTQSVALMLQSSFSEGSAKFYANNLSASGQQSNLKSVSTVPTEWKSFTLPGDGKLGVFASMLGLTTKSLGYAILGGAAIIALLTVNLWEAGAKLVLSLGRACLGSFNHAVSSFFLAISILVSSLIGFMVPKMLINFVTAMVGVVNGKIDSVVPSSITEILSSIVTLVLCYYLAIGAKVGAKKVSPIKMIIGAPNNMAIAFTDRINVLGGNNIGEGLRQGIRGAKQQARRDAGDLANKGKETVEGTVAKPINAAKTTARKTKDTAKGVTLDGAKGAAVGFATGGLAGAAGGAAKGAAKGGFKGATGKEFKNPKKTYEEFIKNAKSKEQNIKPKESARATEKGRKEMSSKNTNSDGNSENINKPNEEIENSNLGVERELVKGSSGSHIVSGKNDMTGAKSTAQSKSGRVKEGAKNSNDDNVKNSNSSVNKGGKKESSNRDGGKKRALDKNTNKTVSNSLNSKKSPVNSKGSARKSAQEKNNKTNTQTNIKKQKNSNPKTNQSKNAKRPVNNQNQNNVKKSNDNVNSNQSKRNSSKKVDKPNQNNGGKRNPITEKRKAKERQQNINVQRRKQQAKNNQKIPNRGK